MGCSVLAMRLSLPPEAGPGLAWQENRNLPRGMVARVQWSSDLTEWHESGDAVDDTSWTVTIRAEGQRRVAHLISDRDGLPVAEIFLRLLVTPGQNAPSRLLQ